MVCDNDVGGVEPASCALIEAISEVGAISFSAVTVFAVDFVPDIGVWDEGDIGEGAIFRLASPVVYRLEDRGGVVE